jgi:hypothetical protein
MRPENQRFGEGWRHMHNEFGLAGRSRRVDQHLGFVRVRSGGESCVGLPSEQSFPRLGTVVFEGSGDDKALVWRKDRDVHRGDFIVKINFTSLESWFQPLQKRSEFLPILNALHRAPRWLSIESRHNRRRSFWPVHHMKKDAITRSNRVRHQSARKTLGLGGKPLVSPHLLVKNERCAFWAGKRLAHQRTYWSDFHLAVFPLLNCRSQAGRATLPRDFSPGKTVAIVGKRQALDEIQARHSFLT